VGGLGIGKKVEVRTREPCSWQGTIESIDENEFRLKHGSGVERVPYGAVVEIEPVMSMGKKVAMWSAIGGAAFLAVFLYALNSILS
jgi:hypothetical protein